MKYKRGDIMKIFSETTVTRGDLSGVRCNRCGREIEKNAFGYFEDYISFSKTWGYHSQIDGEAHDVDICEKCYREWTDTFQIPPLVGE